MNNKNLIIILIIILSVFVGGLTAGMILLMNNKLDFNFMMNFNDSDTKLIDTVTAGNNTINSIKINVYSTDIQIKESNSDIKVEYYSNTEKNTKIVKNDNSIILDESDNDNSCIGFCNIKRKIILYLPTDYTEYLEIKTVSGDIISKVNILNETNIKTTSGDVLMLDANNISIKTTSGDIGIGKVYEKILVNTTSGDIAIKELDFKENSTIETISGDVSINNNETDCYVETSTVSGDTYIKNSNRKSDLVLKIKTISGDILVR